jgi:hypothetical protein
MCLEEMMDVRSTGDFDVVLSIFDVNTVELGSSTLVDKRNIHFSKYKCIFWQQWMDLEFPKGNHQLDGEVSFCTIINTLVDVAIVSTLVV